MIRSDTEAKEMTVGILAFDGIDDGNLFGSSLVFSACNGIAGRSLFNVFCVSVDEQSFTTDSGIQVTSHVHISDQPDIDILVLPAGTGIELAAQSRTLRKWLRTLSTESCLLISICRGAMLVKDMLDTHGIEFTSHPDTISVMSDAAPGSHIVSNVVYRENGNLLTACGLIGPIEAALHVVSGLHGTEFAHKVARKIEYDWFGPDTNKELAKNGALTAD